MPGRRMVSLVEQLPDTTKTILVKPGLLVILISFWSVQLQAQYFMRGAVYDEGGRGLGKVKILLASKSGTCFYTGVSGGYAIPVSVLSDTITLISDGFRAVKTVTYASRFEEFRLRPAETEVSVVSPKVFSIVSFNRNDPGYYAGGESYRALTEHRFTAAHIFPLSGFSLNTDRASYSNIRRFLNIDMPVPPDAVRIEEMLNYFDLSAGDVDPKHFTVCSRVTNAPWNPRNRLLFMSIQAPRLNTDTIPPANLVLLIDVSGSMDQPNRLPLLKEGFKMLVKNLRQQDRLAVVIYGGGVSIYMPPISCMYQDSIKNMIERLEPGGETPGGAAIETAYRVAEEMYSRGANNRIILATDGDFNVGQTTDEEMENIVLKHRQSGIYLTCLGVGTGNYKDSKLEILADKGNGNFAYLDNLQEAEKVLVREFTKTIYPVADDAYVTVTFNADRVKLYRLIGYDYKSDWMDDTAARLEGGEVGYGHSFIAAYEIVPVSDDPPVTSTLGWADIRLHYRMPGTDSTVTNVFHAAGYSDFADAEAPYRFATAVMMFGGLLKQSPLWQGYTWEDVRRIAGNSLHAGDYAQSEFISLVEKAKEIYAPPSKNKRSGLHKK